MNMSDGLISSGGLPPERNPIQGKGLSGWDVGFREPAVLTPQQRDEVRAEAAAIREEEPNLSKRQLRFRLALKYNVSASTIGQITD
jgi:hypothetical protein